MLFQCCMFNSVMCMLCIYCNICVLQVNSVMFCLDMQYIVQFNYLCCLLWCVNIYLSGESLFCLNVLYGDWLGLLIYCIYVSIIIKGFGVSYILCMDEVLCIGLRGDGD